MRILDAGGDGTGAGLLAQIVLEGAHRRLGVTEPLRPAAQMGDEFARGGAGDLALDRLEDKLAKALVRPKKRRPTKPSRSSQRRRVEAKKRRSQTKSHRRKPGRDD